MKTPAALTAMAALLVLSVAGCGSTTQPVPDAGTVDAGHVPPSCQGDGIARCGGECVNTEADVRHCGACQNACAQGAVCFHATCICPSNTMQCGDVCADLTANADHCGACGNACEFGQGCLASVCVKQCQSGLTECGPDCVDTRTDSANCGACGVACAAGKTCQEGLCRCPPNQQACNGFCADLQTDPGNCGSCGFQCFGGYLCEAGQCACPAGKKSCQSACVDLKNDPNNCGGCSVFCQAGQTCNNGLCETPCPSGFTRCGSECVDLQTNGFHCGACGTACGALSCQSGQCATCNSATTDCDSDGWLASDGDCCDQPGACGANPAWINPGAVELGANGVDDNCNALVDLQDQADLRSCDTGLSSSSGNPVDFARAMGICRTTSETAALPQRTWGLISAQLLQANGAPLSYFGAHSIRTGFGAVLTPKEGRSLVVLSSGIAADATQTTPGPNGGPSNTSVSHASLGVDIQNCALPHCIQDWFTASNPPLKLANRLPEAPGCAGGSFGLHEANDSVMLVLRLRAPTNARAFKFNGYFLSSEYPEYVCTTYNDQLVALVDLPGGSPIGALNPPDKNLMTYSNNGQRWPIGINVAKGTSIFKACQTQAQNPSCWDPDVSITSCSTGPSELAGTGFDALPYAPACTNGGGTGWLTTTGNVRPGEIVELRIAIWDVGDHILDSLALLDGFGWLQTAGNAGTTD